MTSHISKSESGFQLPPDVSYEKQRLSDAWAYVFRHRVLGELGRILLQELDDGRCHISCEVFGDPSDARPMLSRDSHGSALTPDKYHLAYVQKNIYLSLSTRNGQRSARSQSTETQVKLTGNAESLLPM